MRRLLVLGVLLLYGVGLLASPLIALAQGQIAVAESQAVPHFPSAITFQLKVRSDADITDVRLRYKVDKMSPATVIGEGWAEFTTAPEVEATWVWDMRKADLPPGAQIEYWWLIKDRSGQRLETEPRRIVFEDTNYEWQRLESGELSLMWYQGGRSLAAELIQAAQEALERLNNDIGARPERPTRIYVYGSTEALKKSLVYPREWTGGLAFSDYGVVLIALDPAQPLSWGKRTIRHELAHLVVGQATFNRYGVTLPTWFSEGLATYAEGDLRSDLSAALEDAIATDRLLSIKTLSSPFPSDYTQAILAYAQSYSLVKFLIATHGRETMLAFLEAFRSGHNTPQALEIAYGLDMDELDTVWREHVGAPPRPTPAPTPVPTIVPSPTPTATPQITVTPTPTTAPTTVATPTPTPALTSAPSATATPTPTAKETATVTSSTPTPTPTPQPSGSGCLATRSGGQSLLSIETLALAGLMFGLAIARLKRRR